MTEKSGDSADGAVVRVVGEWELNFSVRLLFVADHGVHEGYGAVDALGTAVGARVAGAGGNLIYAEAVLEGERRFIANIESVCGRIGYQIILREEYIGREGCRPCRRR